MTDQALMPVAPQAVKPVGADDFFDIDLDRVQKGLQRIREFQAVAKKLMIDGVDYGVIPGTDKPTLLKPGAEKITKLMGLADSYEIVERIEDYEKPLFAYIIRCRLTSISTGNLISQGIGQCNSMESKYRYRWVWPSEVPDKYDKSTLQKREWTKNKRKFTKYRIENDDICSLVNTILKMSKKRSLVDAALSTGRLSEVFNQDLDEIADNVLSETIEIVREDGWKKHDPTEKINEAQRERLWQLCKEVGVPPEKLKKVLTSAYGIENTEDILVADFDKLCVWINEWKNVPKEKPEKPVQAELV